MTVDSAVFAFAGIVNLIGLLLAVIFSPYWLLLCAFVGVNMLQTAFTGFCPAAYVFKRLGFKPGPAFFSKG